MPSSPAVPLPSPDFYLRAPPHEVAGGRVWARRPRPTFHAESATRRSHLCNLPRGPPLAGTLTCPGDGQARTETSGEP